MIESEHGQLREYPKLLRPLFTYIPDVMELGFSNVRPIQVVRHLILGLRLGLGCGD